MWNLVEIWWDNFDDGDIDYFGVWAKSKGEAEKIAKKWAPPSANGIIVIPQKAKNADEFLKINKGKTIDFVVDKDGQMVRVKANKLQGNIAEATMRKNKEVKENYTHFPSLKKLVQINYTDPRNKESDGYKIHTEVEGQCVVDGKCVEGTYVMYEDEAYPGNYIAVHVSNDLNEETGEPEINVVAMDKNKKLVRDRLAYRRRKSKSAVNEAINEVFLSENLN